MYSAVYMYVCTIDSTVFVCWNHNTKRVVGGYIETISYPVME